MNEGDFDLALSGWGPDYDDPLTFGDYYASWNYKNRARYINLDLDEQVRIAQSSTEPKERMRAFGEIQHILLEDRVHLLGYERSISYVVNPQVKGIVHGLFGARTDYSYAYIDPEG